MQELRGSRHINCATTLRRLGITQEVVWLLSTAFGDMAIVALETQHPAKLLAELGAGQCEFDLWLQDQLLALHGVDVQQWVVCESAVAGFASGPALGVLALISGLWIAWGIAQQSPRVAMGAVTSALAPGDR